MRIATIALAAWIGQSAAQTPGAEHREIIEKARAVALLYTANLPNYICTETVRRYQKGKGSEHWKLRDTLTLDLAFSEKGEQHNLTAIDGKRTTKSFRQVHGVRSDVEFGSLLKWIFEPDSQTQFRWERSEDLRGRSANVFSYQVKQEHSDFKITVASLMKRKQAVMGFSGEIFVDRETNMTMRLTTRVDGVPANWPLQAIVSDLDYAYSEIGGQKFLLPLKTEMVTITRDGSEYRNVKEFGDYRKFSSEATINFEK